MREAEKGGWGKRRWFSGSLDLCHSGLLEFWFYVTFPLFYLSFFMFLLT